MGKRKVLALIDRDTGRSRAKVAEDLKVATVGRVVTANLSREAFLMTDEAHRYKSIGRSFAGHGVVNHFRQECVSFENPRLFSFLLTSSGANAIGLFDGSSW